MDDRQLENLYRANFQRVYNYAYYSLLNSAEAEDVTSAVFVKVVANIDKYDASRASFGTWITRIAHNSRALPITFWSITTARANRPCRSKKSWSTSLRSKMTILCWMTGNNASPNCSLASRSKIAN